MLAVSSQWKSGCVTAFIAVLWKPKILHTEYPFATALLAAEDDQAIVKTIFLFRGRKAKPKKVNTKKDKMPYHSENCSTAFVLISESNLEQ